MGQYANQPDFGTKATIVTPSNTITFAENIQSACLYVGVGGNVSVILSGVTNAAGDGPPLAAQAIVFKGVPAGSILPVIVDYVLATGTTATDMISLK